MTNTAGKDAIASVRFSRDDSAYLKGIAMIFMIIHHLFTEDTLPLMLPLAPYLCWWLGNFSQVCVSMFLFASGFGMYRSGDHPSRTLGRIPKLYVRLWIVMLVFTIPVMLLTGSFAFNAVELIKNALAINTTYNSAWWFVFLYAKLMLMHAVFLLLPDKGKGRVHLTLVLLCAGVSVVSFVLTPYTSGIIHVGFSQLSEACFYFTVVLMGRYAAQHDLLERLLTILTRRGKLLSRVITVLLLLTAFGISVLLPYIGIPRLYINWVTSPLVIIAVMLIRYAGSEKRMYRAIVWYGQVSVWTWLIHMTFIAYLPGLTFILRLPVLTVIWLIILNLLPAFLLSLLWRIPQKRNRKSEPVNS